MSLWDRFWVSIRHVRGRLVESILVIVATAIGVSLVAAMVAFIRSYDMQTEYLLSHPAYRELIAETVGNESELTEPAVAFDPAVTREARLGVDDIDVALKSVSLISYGYVSDRTTLSTEMFGGFRGAMRDGEGFTGVQVTPTAPQTGSGSDASTGGSASGSDGAPQGGGFFGFPAPPAGEEGADGGAFAFSDPPPGTSGEQAEDTQGGDAGQGILRFNPRQSGSAPADGQAAGDGEQGAPQIRQFRGDDAERRQFALEQFFAPEEGVLTELPLESFPGVRITPGYFEAYGLQVSEGSLFTREDVERGNQTLVLGSALASTLFPDGDAVGTRVRLGFQTYSIIGVLQPTGLTDTGDGTPLNSMAFVPNNDARVDFGGNIVRFTRGVQTLHFSIGDSAMLAQAAGELQLHFDTEYGTGSVRITAPIETLRAERDKHSRILAVVLFLAAAGLFIASINLFNLMLMRVMKRTKGIGITRAVGASRRDIFRQFLNESAFMSIVGAAIGLAVSPIVYNLLRGALISDVSAVRIVYWPFLLIGGVGALAFSVLFGLYPARQAGQIDAAIAVRTE